MADTRLTVLFAGPHVSFQDGGRPGQMRFGVPRSGGMDRASLAIANAALGNLPGATAVEVSMGGLTLRCDGPPVTVAVAGGGFIVEGRERLGAWTVLTLQTGDRLVIRPGPWGAWSYLAVAGHITAPAWLGSTSTHASSNSGGGRIRSGQVLAIRNPRVLTDGPRTIPCPVWARPRHVAHVVAGPQDHHFSAAAMHSLTHETFYMSNAYDRMGTRLNGPSLAPEGALSIPSEPIVRGSVQVSGDGVATILMADHQTTGGYPKIATVISSDLDGLAQLRPRDAIRFVPVTPDEGIARARMQATRLADFIARLSRN